jgi:hypothetical protein
MLYERKMPVRNIGGKCPFEIWEGSRPKYGKVEEYFIGRFHRKAEEYFIER